MKPPSRVAGRGVLVRALRRLVWRVGRYAEFRAASSGEQRWAARLFDRLQEAFRESLHDGDVRDELAAVDRRRAATRKDR